MSVLIKLFDGDLMAQFNKLNIQLKVAEQTLGRYDALLKINYAYRVGIYLLKNKNLDFIMYSSLISIL